MAEMHPFSGDQVIVALQQENAALRQANAQLQTILHQRAEPILTQVVDALSTVSQLAQQGNPAAKAIIDNWQKALSLAAEAGAGIVVVRGMPANGVGPK